jgi:hypothetical protein
MAIDFSFNDALLAAAVTLVVVMLLLGIGWLATWFVSHRD